MDTTTAGRHRPRLHAVAVAALSSAVVLGLASAAAAERYEDPLHLSCVGTDGADADWANGDCDRHHVAVSEGGCARGRAVAVAVGESGRCAYGYEASNTTVAVGLDGADAHGRNDTGYWPYYPPGYLPPGVAVTDSGGASSLAGVAVSGTGNATNYRNGIAVSGTGDAANPSCPTIAEGAGCVSVSGTGRAVGGTVAVSGTGTASGGFVAVAGGDSNANGGPLAVSLTGDACGAGLYALAPMGQAC